MGANVASRPRLKPACSSRCAHLALDTTLHGPSPAEGLGVQIPSPLSLTIPELSAPIPIRFSTRCVTCCPIKAMPRGFQLTASS